MSTAVRVTKKRTVYERDLPGSKAPAGGRWVRFQSDPGQLEGNAIYNMELDDWQELGEPNFITVTVEPGDLLN
jgi:hypothetical protein